MPKQYKSYSDKLRNPKWQKKRLEILEEHDWKCDDCKAKTKELHVHHIAYVSGNDPWEYPDTAFLVLCSKCHDKHTKQQRQLAELMNTFSGFGMEISCVDLLCGYLKGFKISFSPVDVEIMSKDELVGVSDSTGLSQPYLSGCLVKNELEENLWLLQNEPVVQAIETIRRAKA